AAEMQRHGQVAGQDDLARHVAGCAGDVQEIRGVRVVDRHRLEGAVVGDDRVAAAGRNQHGLAHTAGEVDRFAFRSGTEIDLDIFDGRAAQVADRDRVDAGATLNLDLLEG